MNLLEVYIIASALAAAWVACIWSGRGWVNITLKALYTAIAFAGAVVIAKTIL